MQEQLTWMRSLFDSSTLYEKTQTSPALSWLVFIVAAIAVVIICAVLSVVLVKKIKALLKMTK